MSSLTELRDETLKGLKRFQRATVKRIDELYRNGQMRVLVADEVGLGKTLIARGVIANTALLRKEEGDNLFKVVYVCSNQTIARQNINKLRISDDHKIDNSSETRLSMQHLLVLEQEQKCLDRRIFVQLTPLTPSTSFQITNRTGSYSERALMYCILSRVFGEIPPLSEFLRCRVNSDAWQSEIGKFKQRIAAIQTARGSYPDELIQKLKSSSSLLEDLRNYLNGAPVGSPNRLIVRLRRMFAELSAGMLQPDLVIMDEFQRFKSLLNPTDDDDLKTITEKFLRCDADVKDRPRILLLSATPYKLYSTLDEIDEANCDEQYREFIDVVDFLLDQSEMREREFRGVWHDYSRQLREMQIGTGTILQVKQQAEDELYRAGMCRTERLSFVKSGDFLTDASQEMQVIPGDVLSYVELSEILNRLGLWKEVPYEFVKSSPYLMSFMDQYVLKKEIRKACRSEVGKKAVRGRKSKSLVWLKRSKINEFQELPKIFAKFELLRSVAFEHHAERLLWIPPSMPYYEPQGVFKEAEGYSKLLIFSSWEMVPRMIASLISYDAECRTNGKLSKQHLSELRKSDRREQKNLHYFSKQRYPSKRLFRAEAGEDRLRREAEILRCQSHFLEDCFIPSGCDVPLAQVRSGIISHLPELPRNCPAEKNPYCFLAEWLDQRNPDLESERQVPVPTDARRVLADMALAAPGICIGRALHQAFPKENPQAVKIAVDSLTALFLRLFDSPEGAGAVARSPRDLDEYPVRILNYCVAGNFQAMFDEYLYLVRSEIHAPDLDSTVQKISEALNIRTATFDVDTYDSFVAEDAKQREKLKIKLRSHYAAGFSKGTKDKNNADSEKAERKEVIRNVFNSPFRPFVLASTSVGQEGLDFHYYCRKIMHWNLPRNPVELEQREGRINRYQCLAIRQSLVQKFKTCPKRLSQWGWPELFRAADEWEREVSGDAYSQLAPFWCLSENQPVKIERLVPLYPFSRDTADYKRLLKVLSLYRLTMGQPRQEKILKSILANKAEELDSWQKLFLSLCPFKKEPYTE